MIRTHHFILGTCLWALACSPAQDSCGGKVANVRSNQLNIDSGQSISLIDGQGLGGLLFYNSTVSMDPSLAFEAEHVAARSVFFWFYKDPSATGTDQYRVMILGKKFLISDASQRDYVIAVWVGDGYLRLPVKGLLTQQIQKFATDTSLWTGATSEVNLKRSLVSAMFGLQSSTSLQNGVADDATSRQQWCFAASPQCLSPNDLGVVIASIDFSDLNRHHMKVNPDGESTNADVESWFDRFVQHQNTLKTQVSADTMNDFMDLLILHKAIYENSTRAKLLNADLSQKDAKFSTYRDTKVPLVHDCKSKTLAEFKTWVANQNGSASVEYCLPGVATKLAVQINITDNNPASFTEFERIALLQELLNRFYSLASKDQANWYINFNKIGAVVDGNAINDKLVYQSLAFSEFIQPTLAVNSIGFQNYADTEAGHFYINYKDKTAFPHTQYPDFNHDFQENSIITYKRIFPIQVLPNRDSLGESGGASVNRLPASKTPSRSAGNSNPPEEPAKEEDAGAVSTKNCK